VIRTLAFAAAAALLVSAAAPAFAQPVAHRAPTGGEPRELGARAENFVRAAAQSDEFERRAGRRAQSMARSQRVRDFGGMMVQDHTMSTRDLQAAIRRSGHDVPPPPPLQPDQQRMLDQLKSAGQGFDFMYLKQQVQAHQEALSLLQSYARDGHNAVLRAAARQTIPMVRKHLEAAQNLQASVRH